jgi:protein arginine kinase activator
MLCQECQKRPATVHITQVLNNQKTERHLCEECARQQPTGWSWNTQSPFSINQLLGSLIHEDQRGATLASREEEEHCENCGLTYGQFSQTGKLGCADCYHKLTGKLSPLLRRIHGSSEHRGKLPRQIGKAVNLRQKISQLRRDLQQAVSQEEYEKAAQFRDRIRELEQQLQGGK